MRSIHSRTVLAAAVVAAATSASGEEYHVAVRHPAASDEAPGTRDRPWKTISKAATSVQPGDCVLIHGGVYREHVVLKNSGTEEAPITFAAAPAAEVTVTGADRITAWEKVEGDGNVYSTAWPHRFIPWSKTGHHPADDYHKMIGRCEQVHADNYPLLHVLSRGTMSRGTFFVDLEAKRLYVWEPANRVPGSGDCAIEASVRPFLWQASGDYLHVRGIRFRYAANPAQKGAVQVRGKHNLMEDCVVERMNAAGAVFGGEHNTIRRCVFQDNGWDGFDAGGHDILMTECVVRNNNTKGWNRGWGGGGNKIVFSRGFVIEKSTFVGNRGHGIWFDIGNEDCVVRNCLIAHNENAGIFYEISYGLHAHDNVIVGNGLAPRFSAWGANGGIAISSSPDCVIERNLLVANKEGLQFREQTRKTPRIDDRSKEVPVWNHDIIVRSNVIAYNRDAQTAGWFATKDGRHWPLAMQAAAAAEEKPGDLHLEKLGLVMDGNVYYAAPGQSLFQWGCLFPGFSRKVYGDLSEVARELGLERGSRVHELAFAGNGLILDFRLPADSPALAMGCYPKGSVPAVRLGPRPAP